MNRKIAIMVLLALLWPWNGMTQELLPHAWQNYIEILSDEGDDESVEELLELFDLYHEHPASLNDTSDALSSFPFVSDLQRDRLKAYITQYGWLFSIEELYIINGFDSMTVELLRPLVKTEPAELHKSMSLKELLARGRSNLVLGASGTIEQARGYRDTIYEGDNLRLMWRYQFKSGDRLQLQLSGEKDPGEAFFRGSQTKGFDFYGYNLVLNDIGRWQDGKTQENNIFVKRVAVGQYHLQFGQGLTLWSGFGPRMTIGTAISRQAQGIRANGAFTEYGYLQGIASAVALGQHWVVTLFGSYVNRDATLPRKADSTNDTVQSLYNSGYHRTDTEINKRNQLGEYLYGGHIEYRNPNLRIGITGVATQLDKTILPATYVYNDNAFRGNHNLNAGVDFSYRHRRILLFGEVAVCSNRAFDSASLQTSPAAVAGMEYYFNNSHRLSGLLRYFSPTYHNLHANAFGQNSTPQNEIGAALGYQGRLPWGTSLAATADLFRFPHMKYLVYAPSHGQEYNLMLSHSFHRLKGFAVNLRYRYKERGRNITPSTMVDGHYLLEQTYRHQVLLDLEYKTGPWRLISRVGYAHYHGNVTEADRGLLFYQDVQYNPQTIPLTVAARLALFDVNDYEARMYAAESNFIYQYTSTLYQNEGCRFYLLLRYDITPNWNIGFKYGITAYTDKDTFGSSYEQINANHRQQWRIQMRLKW
ncbi:MAG: hypothetical protein IKN11_06515 [Bacteroidales bacterium]|nr:hypothetical protein [Bacteroidales bacterium]